ncbi:MAG: aminotransferase class IV [Ferruginibacter sp.]|nr:aminotransferase class IV [Ferruginibacter sp.]
MNYFNYNGKILNENELIIGPQNRGLRYGDGIFETMKYKHGNIILMQDHFERLWYGLKLLQFEIPKLFTPHILEEEIIKTINKNKLKTARVRLTIIRDTGGIYDAKNNFPNYIIETFGLQEENGQLNANGLQLCFFENAKKSIDIFSNIKHNNFLPYFMGAMYTKKMHCNDAIILNTAGNICDTTIANIFYIKNNTIYTPALTQGCVSGVMRKWLIKKLEQQKFIVNECCISKSDLLNADEIFLTNSIYNIKWVDSIENNTYKDSKTRQIVNELIRTESEIYC